MTPENADPQDAGRRSSQGGSAAAGGVDFDALVFAWMASHMVSNTAIDDWRLADGRLTAAGGQTGAHMDDCGGITRHPGRIYVQAKRRLFLGEPEKSPLARAIDQAARQFRAGNAEDGDRPLEEHRDLLAIITDRRAGATIRIDLAEVVDLLSSLPDELPLETAGAGNERRAEALRLLLVHARRSLARAYGTESVDERVLRSFFRVLFVGVLELEPGEPERRSAEGLLRQIITEPERASEAFEHLARDAQVRGIKRQWARVPDIRAHLRRRGLSLLHDPPYRDDIARLAAVTTSSVQVQRAQLLTIQAPDGVIEIERSVVETLRNVEGVVALIGDAGSGKSAAAVRLACQLLEQGRDVVYLPADALESSIATARGLTFATSLPEALTGWDGDSEGTLIVDGIDSTRGTMTGEWVTALLPELAGSRWRVIVTLRTHDLRSNEHWRQTFRGVPVDEHAAVPDLVGIRYLLVGDLDDDELEQVKRQSADLGHLIDEGDEQLLSLLRNPFNLNLAADLLATGSTDVATARSRLDLLNRYWQRRVQGGAQGLQQQAAIRRLVGEMLHARRSTLDVVNAVDPSQLEAIQTLLHGGVLRETRAEYAGSRLVEFSHPLLFDYAVSAEIFSVEPPDFVSRLDADRNLTIRLWPSVELYLASVWQRDATRSRFWDLVLRLAGRPDGHPLAGIAAAFVVLGAHPEPEDFASLFLALRDERSQDALRILNHIAGALNCPEIPILDRIASVPALSEATAVTAEIAREHSDNSMADATRVLLRRIDHPDVAPLGPGALGGEARARAVCSLTEFALADPTAEGRMDVARMVSSMLAACVLIDPERCIPVLEATLAQEVLAHWGVLVVRSTLDQIPVIAPSLPDLARRLFEAPWSFEETRETGLGFGGQLSLMTMSWRSAQDTCRYHSSEVFPRFLRAAPAAAATALVNVLTRHGASSHTPGLIVQPELSPHDEPLPRMGKQVGQWLLGVAGESAVFEPALDILSTDPTANPALWQSIFSAGAAHPATLGRSILERVPAQFFDPALLSLGAFVEAMSNELTGDDHVGLERRILAVTAPQVDNEEWTVSLRSGLACFLNRLHVELGEVRALLPAEDQAPTPQQGPPLLGWTGADDGAVPWEANTPQLPPEVETLLADARTVANNAMPQADRLEALSRLQEKFAATSTEFLADAFVTASLAEAARALAQFDWNAKPDGELGAAMVATLIAVLDVSP
ncbi:MAG: hypothetical protein JWO62_1488 [Acidimicrobiaceae bacterium]|nr:hypothetical protein [Acidimicrobiaceae bacterium]